MNDLQEDTMPSDGPDPDVPDVQERVSDYWAACPSDEIAKEAMTKVDKYYSYLISSNLTELWRRSYRAYYGMRQNVGASGWGVFDVGSLIASGDQGEIVRVKINHFANLITHQHVMTTSTRPALQCRAINSDAESMIASQLGDGIVEYFMRERSIEKRLTAAVEIALVLSEGYVVLGWDATAGKQYGVGPNGTPLFDGDLVARNFTPFQMVKDVTKNSDEEQTWYITHSKRNKYDLMTKYPALAEKIAKVQNDDQTATNRTFADPSKIIAATSFGSQDSDDIPYYELYHKVTDSMPQGRYTIFCGPDVCLFDGPLPFREVPVYRVTPKDIIGSPFGWTVAFDGLAVQELIDKLYTVVSTNTLGGGMTNFWSPPGNNLSVSQIGGAMNLLESAVEPKVLQTLNTPAEVYNYISKLESVMETLFGVSAINRGDIPSADMSGSAMAFLASQAITFSSGLQSSYNMLQEAVGTGIVNILKDFARTPRIAVISGKVNRPLMKIFTGAQLEPINNVVCDAISALSKTTAGKMTIADNLLNAGKIDTPQEYITLVETGQMDPLTRSPLLESFLIQSENEELLQGINPPVLKIDKHIQHIIEHKTLISSPASRRNAKLVNAVLDHIAQHEATQLMLQQKDPALLAAIQEPPLPEPPPPPPTAAPPAPGAGPQPAGNAGGIAAALRPGSPVAQQAATVKAPKMPNLPAGTDPQTAASYAKLKGAS